MERIQSISRRTRDRLLVEHFEHMLTILFSAECARSSQCSGYRHHYEECVERVTAQHEDADYKGPKEDCVEECKQLASRCVRRS